PRSRLPFWRRATGRSAASDRPRRGGFSSGVGVDEREHAPPRVLGRLRELLLLAVEEAVRGARVRDDLVLDAGRGERLVEGRVHLGGDVLVGARLEREDRALHPVDALDRAGAGAAAAGDAVEADRAREAVAGGGREPGVVAAEAEADGEDGAGAAAPQLGDAGGHVGLDPLLGGLLDVGRVVPAVGALVDAGGAPEVVERDRRVAVLGEAEREL